VPVNALIGVYARESGHGLLFADSDEPAPRFPSTEPRAAGAKPGRPHLKVIK